MRVIPGLCGAAVFALLVAGCSSGSGEDAKVTTVTSTVTSTAEAPADATPSSAADEATPAVPVPTQVEPASGDLPASRFVDGSGYSFASPSKKIECRGTSQTLVCQTLNNRHTVDPALLCNFYPGDEQGNANQFGFFDFDRPLCATIVQGEAIRSPHTLEYGQRVAFTPRPGLTILCGSSTTGVVCANPDGFGFGLSDTTFTRFRAN